MKYLLTLPLILFSLFSHSEDELDRIFNDIESKYKKLSGKYYCISQTPFMYNSKNFNFKSDYFLITKDDPYRKPKGTLIVDYLNKSIDGGSYLGMKSIPNQCRIVGNYVLSCFEYMRSRSLTFDPNSNEFFLTEHFDGRIVKDAKGFITAEIGQCEKVD